MKITISFVLAVLHILNLHPSAATPMPQINHYIGVRTLTTSTPTPTPTVLLPPTKFSIKVVTKTAHGLSSLGYITRPSSSGEGSLIHISSTASPFYFLQKSSTGSGIVWSTPEFFTPSDFALAWDTNITSPHSKVYLSNLLTTDGFLVVDMIATRMFDDKNLYFSAIGNGLDGGPNGAEVVFSVNKETGELWVNTSVWKFPTVYLEVVPITTCLGFVRNIIPYLFATTMQPPGTADTPGGAGVFGKIKITGRDRTLIDDGRVDFHGSTPKVKDSKINIGKRDSAKMPNMKSANTALTLIEGDKSKVLTLTVGTHNVTPGQEIHRAEAQEPPELAFNVTSGTYIVIGLDLDAPFVSLPILGPILHWIQPGLQPQQAADGVAKLVSTNSFIANYIGPAPPPGSLHRYVFILYAQPKDFDAKKYSPADGKKMGNWGLRSWETKTDISKMGSLLVLLDSVYRSLEDPKAVATKLPISLEREDFPTFQMSPSPKVITLEEHVVFPSLGDDCPFYHAIWDVFPERRKDARDCSTRRIADMDAGGVTFQIMSHLPGMGTTSPDRCRSANGEMADAIKENPKRFGGFAVLPMAFPDEAAREFERTVKDLKFCGALVDNHLEDMTHYDDEKFWPVFAVAERLDVPIYLHPAPPSDKVVQERFSGNYSPLVAMGLSTGAWGWQENVGLHILKLYAAGLFERFPRLKIVIGHMGELLPAMIDRVERLAFFRKMAETRQKGMKQVWEQNIWVTTSGMFDPNAMATLLKVTPIEHILFSVDYPFESNKTGREFLDLLSSSDLVTKEELDMIAYKNAEKLLKL
ncbi:hypothetical protein G7Y89_g6373 [Cudoniella acicularis]|uniref:Amidohydrolase-related domain-containing protein n=1 Tax=Cudoniella acicularis TaxID=354080 RepID=A0A8H4RMD2_9HELO|nr:hypothetical protein G7Y89_g6373 [Cudoniella acicularis]